MAWRKRYGGYKSRAYSYGGRARRWAGRNRKGIGIGGTYAAGVIIGLTEYDKMIPVELKVGLACLPTGVTRMIPGGSTLANLMRGILVGDVIQARTGVNLSGFLGGNGSGSSSSSSPRGL